MLRCLTGLAIGLLPVGLPAATFSTEPPAVLARVGDPAPGGGVYHAVYWPTINESGIAIFRASVDYGPGDRRLTWYMVDTYASMEPFPVLIEGQPAPDQDGQLDARFVFLRPQGRTLDFSAIVTDAAPGTGQEGWFTRHEDGTLTERVRVGKPLTLSGEGEATIPCLLNVDRNRHGRLVFHGELVDDPGLCPTGLGGPVKSYMLEPSGLAHLLVATGDPIINRPGATIGNRIVLGGGGQPLKLFGNIHDGGAFSGAGLFRLESEGVVLDFASGDVIDGIGPVLFDAWAASRDVPGIGYLVRATLQPTAQVPQRHGILRLGSDNDAVLLETGQELPGFGSVTALAQNVIRVGSAMAQRVSLADGAGVVGVSIDGELTFGARTNVALPGTEVIGHLGPMHVLDAGTVVHVAHYSGPSAPSILVRAQADGPRVLLPPTMPIDGTTHRFEWSPDPLDAPVNERGQIVARATPSGTPTQDGKIVYFGERVFADGFEP
jgi:hypothetical protein